MTWSWWIILVSFTAYGAFVAVFPEKVLDYQIRIGFTFYERSRKASRQLFRASGILLFAWGAAMMLWTAGIIDLF